MSLPFLLVFPGQIIPIVSLKNSLELFGRTRLHCTIGPISDRIKHNVCREIG
jgi:hypothetical protein